MNYFDTRYTPRFLCKNRVSQRAAVYLYDICDNSGIQFGETCSEMIITRNQE